MLLSNATRQLLTITTRRTVSKVSHRGFAVAATQQIHSKFQGSENLQKGSKLGWLAATAAAAGAAVAVEDRNKTDCCGIAGVVGAKGDAR